MLLFSLDLPPGHALYHLLAADVDVVLQVGADVEGALPQLLVGPLLNEQGKWIRRLRNC